MPTKKHPKSTSTIQTKPPLRTFQSIPTQIPNGVWLVAGLWSLMFLGLYITTAPRTIVVYADSSVLLAIAYNLGVGHPPGYPIYLLLLHLFTNLPLGGTVAFRGHVLSAVLHSLSLLFLFIACYRSLEFLTLNYPEKKSLFPTKLGQIVVSMLATASLGLSFLFWLYGSVAEKYAYNDLLIAVFLFLTVFLLTSHNHLLTRLTWIGWAGVLGLAITHHLASIFLLIPAGFVIWQQRQILRAQRRWAELILVALACIGLYLGSLWYLNTLNTPVSWRFEPTIQGITRHILRAEFSKENAMEEVILQTYLQNANLNHLLATIPPYLNTVYTHVGWVTIVLFLVGAIYWRRYAPRVSGPILVGAAIQLGLLPLYIGWSENTGTQAVVMRQYLLGYMFIPLLVGVGLWELLSRVEKIRRILQIQQSRWIQLGVGGMSVGVLAYGAVLVYPQVNLRSFDFIHRYYSSILNDLPENAVLACFTDTACFAFYYLQTIDHLRSDVVVVPNSYPFVRRSLASHPDLHGYEYPLNPYKTYDYLTWNIDKRPIFVVDLPEEYYTLLGMNYGFTYYIPHGYYSELVRYVPEEADLPKRDFAFSEEMKAMPIPELDLMRRWLKMSMARYHVFNSVMYEKAGFWSKARQELDYTSDLLYQVPEVSAREIENTRTRIESAKPLANFLPGSTVQDIDQIQQYADEFVKKGQIGRAYVGYQGMITIDPLHQQARIKLAQMLEKMGNLELALQEYRNVLRYYSQNETAQQGVARLGTSPDPL